MSSPMLLKSHRLTSRADSLHHSLSVCARIVGDSGDSRARTRWLLTFANRFTSTRAHIFDSRLFIWRSRVRKPAWVRYLGVLAALLPGRRRGSSVPDPTCSVVCCLSRVERSAASLERVRFRLFRLLRVLHGDVNSRFLFLRESSDEEYMLSSWFLRLRLSTCIVWLLLLPSDSQLSSSCTLNVLAIFPSDRVTSCPTILFLSEHCSHHSFHAESLLVHLAGMGNAGLPSPLSSQEAMLFRMLAALDACIRLHDNTAQHGCTSLVHERWSHRLAPHSSKLLVSIEKSTLSSFIALHFVDAKVVDAAVHLQTLIPAELLQLLP